MLAYHPEPSNDLTWLTRLVRSRIFDKSPVGAYLRWNRLLWNSLPGSVLDRYPIRLYGDFLNILVRTHSPRGQLHCTFFLRNRPALELLHRLVERTGHRDTLRVTVLGCSTGAEAYSIAWRIRSARPELGLVLTAIDISQKAVEFAKSGVYVIGGCQFTGTDLFDSLTEAEIAELFDRDNNVARVKSYIRDVIRWHVGDATDPAIVDALGPQDVVVANNFLCHMERSVATKCLHNIGQLLDRGGYLFVSGVDLDIKTEVARRQGWIPIEEHLEEVHNGDPRMTRDWPFNYSSLEPLNKRRQNWKIRYAQAFKISNSVIDHCRT
jgi:chemotaxis protein methyltransferase CheR